MQSLLKKNVVADVEMVASVAVTAVAGADTAIIDYSAPI